MRSLKLGLAAAAAFCALSATAQADCVKVGMLQRDDVRAGGRVVEVAERMPAKSLNSFDQLGRKEARVGLDSPRAETV